MMILERQTQEFGLRFMFPHRKAIIGRGEQDPSFPELHAVQIGSAVAPSELADIMGGKSNNVLGVLFSTNSFLGLLDTHLSHRPMLHVIGGEINREASNDHH